MVSKISQGKSVVPQALVKTNQPTNQPNTGLQYVEEKDI